MHPPQGQIRPRARRMFDTATKYLVQVIQRSPFECITFDVMKGLLGQYARVLQSVTTKDRTKINKCLEESFASLQQYWNAYFANVFQSMRTIVGKTKVEIDRGMGPKKLGARALKL